ncbi:hypothetical protein B0H16DRAFT_1735547 [Mycena metata]|uniref:Uncharacterized protein n=1 Tax=Mycena metata TaxID=1033252 RepID=A0AAD7MPV8_9AGAR|nr:hypothetical protein B0H16DRAFT_1735547 [Mycena metata]
MDMEGGNNGDVPEKASAAHVICYGSVATRLGRCLLFIRCLLLLYWTARQRDHNDLHPDFTATKLRERTGWKRATTISAFSSHSRELRRSSHHDHEHDKEDVKPPDVLRQYSPAGSCCGSNRFDVGAEVFIRDPAADGTVLPSAFATAAAALPSTDPPSAAAPLPLIA